MAKPDYRIHAAPGKSLSPERMQRIIELFRKLDDAEQGYHSGNGLVLSRPDSDKLENWFRRRPSVITADDRDGNILGFASNGKCLDYDNAGRAERLQAALRKAWERRHPGESFTGYLPKRMARFRQYRDIPFPSVKSAETPQEAKIRGYYQQAMPFFNNWGAHRQAYNDLQSYINAHPEDMVPVADVKKYAPSALPTRYDKRPSASSMFMSGGRPMVNLKVTGNGKTSRSFASHEFGHAQDFLEKSRAAGLPPRGGMSRFYPGLFDYSNGYAGKVDASKSLQANLSSKTRPTEYDGEVAAWNKARGPYDPNIRDKALRTYSAPVEDAWMRDYAAKMQVPAGWRTGARVGKYGNVSRDTVSRFVSTHSPAQASEHMKRLSSRNKLSGGFGYSARVLAVDLLQ